VIAAIAAVTWGAASQGAAPQEPTRRAWWSFQPLRSVKVPAVRDREWGANPLDRFIRAAQEAKGVTPAAEAPPAVLLRRLYFDLIGLPPAPEEVEAFVREAEAEKGAQRGSAYAKRADSLLAGPQFGERWARHWLDLARYADSDGQESDADRPYAYRYRDFIIRAFNEDLPYDTFVRYQLAGDELEPKNPEAISATGFVVAGTYANLDSVPMEEEKIRSRLNERDDMLSTTGQAFLGLTLGCARCHDHKYDPIPTRDYYRMQAAFNSGERGNVDLPSTTPGASPGKAFVMKDFGATPRPTFLLERGDLYLKKEPLELGFLTALQRDKSAADYVQSAKAAGGRQDTTYQRAAMAEWITDTKHGAGALLARVIVNRLWQHHFGEGLVRTPNDFGVRGEEPTHPELLEWLANYIPAKGWKLKRLHRMMVLSKAYRQGSAQIQKPKNQTSNSRIDPENRLLWRRRPMRLEAEAFRDAMLAVSGELDRRTYGAPYKAPLQPEALQARNTKNPYPADLKDTPETHRRTIYMFHKRVVPSPLLQAFDQPDGSLSCGRRSVTTVAPQALAVLNEPFVRARAAAFARRIVAEAGADLTARVQRAYRLALSRQPSATEVAASARFLKQATERRRPRDGNEASLLALTDFAQALFGLNEFVYVD
jgi:hypothetical protein